MDFKLDKSHLLQQELYRKFAETEIKPLAKEMDENEAYDQGLLDKMQKYGFFGIPYSQEYGGGGSDTLAYTLCMEEVSKIDASTGITISVHTSLCCSGIEEFGTEEQKQKYLRPLVDGSKIGCFGLTEPGAGSDVAGAQTETKIPIIKTEGKVFDGLFYKKIRSFLDAIKEGKPAPVPSSQILYNQAIIDGIVKSAELGREIEINIPEI